MVVKERKNYDGKEYISSHLQKERGDGGTDQITVGCGIFVCSLSFQFFKMESIVSLFMLSQNTVTTSHSGVRSVKN